MSTHVEHSRKTISNIYLYKENFKCIQRKF